MTANLVLPARYDPDLVLLGSGGFGTVYRTIDRDRDVPVAVKVPHRTGRGDLAREVLVELRAAASLRHPGFVQILDAGLATETAPFLVMEYADGGSLERLVREGTANWDEIAPLVDALLDALAHAHARGLIHRDIKPENVLLGHLPDGSLVPKLADFGLAKVLARRGGYRETRLGGGTIPYMPPEAFNGDASGIHPGADLYAFGVLLYQLLCGQLPWDSADLSIVLAKAEGHHSPLRARPGAGCPPHVEGVIERLLVPDPVLRFSLAAEVRAALFHPGGARPAAPASAAPGVTADSSIDCLAPSLPNEVPERPRAEELAPSPAIASLREPLLVDRDSERSRLWELARQGSCAPVGVVLSGPAGGGRSRLCQWLTTTMEEIGAARTLRLRIDGTTSPAEAAVPALRRFLLVQDATGGALRERIGTWLAARGHEAKEDADALCTWLDQKGASPVALLDPEQAAARRIALLERVLRLESRRGLACVWFEEEAPDARSAEFCAELMRRSAGEPFPLLVLYEQAGGTSASPALGSWQSLDVGPLADGYLEALMSDLAVDGARVPGLLARAEGIPLRAVESARLLFTRSQSDAAAPRVDQDAAIPIDEGGDEDASVEAPTLVAPERIGMARLLDFLSAGAGADERQQRIHLATVLSLLPRPCPEELLQAAWTASGGGAWDGARASIDEARYRGLLVREEDGALDFAGVPLARAAAEHADIRPGIAEIRAAVAGLLLGRPSPPPGLLRHAARLLAGAGRHCEALDVLVPLGETLLAGDADAAARVWSEAADALRAADLPASDQRIARVALGSARAARRLGDVRQAEAYLDSVDVVSLPAARQGEWHETRASVMLLRAELEEARRQAVCAIEQYERVQDASGIARARLLAADALSRAGRRQEAIPVFEAALDEAQTARAVREELWARWLLARCLRAHGNRARAGRELLGVLALARRNGVAAVEGGALRELGNLAVIEGRLGEAEGPLKDSIRRLEAAGLRAEAAVTRISLGELARARGDLGAARTQYSAALAVVRAYGLTSEELAALVNLGIAELGLDKARSAARRLAEIDGLLARDARHSLRCHVDALRVAVRASEARWEEAEEGLEKVASCGPPSDPDVMWLLEHAAGLASRGGEVPLAGDAWALAARIATSLGDDQAVRRIRRGLQGMG